MILFKKPVRFCSMILILAFFSPLAKGQTVKFKVKNNTSWDVKGLEISSDQKTWGAFSEVNVETGSSKELSWKRKPDDVCEQYVRAEFSNETRSTPTKVDFCQNRKLLIQFGKAPR